MCSPLEIASPRSSLEVRRAERVIFFVSVHTLRLDSGSRVDVLLSGPLRVPFVLFFFNEQPVDARVGRVERLVRPAARYSAGRRRVMLVEAVLIVDRG